MSEIRIQLGVRDPTYTVPSFDPGVIVTINGDHVLSMEVLKYLEAFTSPAGPIEVE